MWMTIQQVLGGKKKPHGGGSTPSSDDDSNGDGGPKPVVESHTYAAIWFLWLLTGTLWYGYAPESDLGFIRGFYMAVNIGYSIGFGFPAEPYTPYLWFSVLYVLFGSSLVAVALGFFANKIIEDADQWYTNLLQRKEYEINMAPDKPFHTRLSAFLKFREHEVRAVGALAAWLAIMIMYSLIHVKWDFVEGIYFAVSTLSTGGHYGIPSDSPTWMFGVTGVFAAVGIPLFGVAMASLATLVIDRGDIEEVKDSVRADVTVEELIMLSRFGLEDGDNQISKAEYMILCMIRLGIDARAISFVEERFRELDHDGSGTLDIKEITGGKVTSAQYATAERNIPTSFDTLKETKTAMKKLNERQRMSLTREKSNVNLTPNIKWSNLFDEAEGIAVKNSTQTDSQTAVNSGAAIATADVAQGRGQQFRIMEEEDEVPTSDDDVVVGTKKRGATDFV